MRPDFALELQLFVGTCRLVQARTDFALKLKLLGVGWVGVCAFVFGPVLHQFWSSVVLS